MFIATKLTTQCPICCDFAEFRVVFFTSETRDSSLKPLGENPKHMLEANLRLILLLKGNIHIHSPDFMTARTNSPLLKGVSRLSLLTDNFFFWASSKIRKKSPV